MEQVLLRDGLELHVQGRLLNPVPEQENRDGRDQGEAEKEGVLEIERELFARLDHGGFAPFVHNPGNLTPPLKVP